MIAALIVFSRKDRLLLDLYMRGTSMTSDFFHNLIGFVALVLVPTFFWFGVVELIALSLQFSYGGSERLAVGGSIFLLTLWVWTLLLMTGDD